MSSKCSLPLQRSDVMMVLRHIGPPATVVRHGLDDEGPDEEAPIDLSTKIVRGNGGDELSGSGSPSAVPSCHQSVTKSPFHSITSPISSAHYRSPPSRFARDETTRLIYRGSVVGSDVRWRDRQMNHGNDEESSSFSSPDSGLQRDSPGEDEDGIGHKSGSPPLNVLRQSLIPLSLIRARYNNHHSSNNNNSQRADNSSGASGGTEDSGRSDAPPDQVQTKRARLEEMVSHIKQSKPPKDRQHRHSGDDDTSSGDHVISSDEIAEDGPADLRNLGLRLAESTMGGANPLAICRDGFPMRSDEDEPCNLAFTKGRSNNSCSDTIPFEMWKIKGSKTMQPLSPSDAAKMYSADPESYQQQMMQLQLTSAAMLGDPGGLLKAMGNYPPWVYLGYYSQLLHSYQAQEILRQYAMQSQNSTPPVSQGEKSPSVPHTLGSSGYNCGSPMSPASLSEGQNGVDSDGSVVGQGTSGSANGKRAPRAMTGRHVRTGTGASPSTLKTLREKIEERQRLKAQQLRQGVLVVQNHTGKVGKVGKVYKKARK